MASFQLPRANYRRHLTGAMPCPEYNRLRRYYEVALRRWGHLLLSLDAHLVGAATRQAAELKQKAFDERNAAKERLNTHVLTCPACNPKLKRIHRSIN
jgi:hypothetical protein